MAWSQGSERVGHAYGNEIIRQWGGVGRGWGGVGRGGDGKPRSELLEEREADLVGWVPACGVACAA